MRITPLPDAEPRPRRVAVGTFDGVHLGHREVIRGCDTVLTFDPHPASVVSPEGSPPLLTTLERKAELVAGLGVEELVVIAFDDAFARQEAVAFVDEVLVGRLRATHVAVGRNFRFGHGATGDTALLAADGRFTLRVAELVEVDGEVVSSTRIRRLLVDGAVAEAARLLGAPFLLAGPVVHGDQRGRTLGYPTANLVPPAGFVCPGHGVYACRATLAGDATSRAAAVSIGVRPQFDGRHPLVEAYLLDFAGDVYGRVLRLEFLERLRGEQRFPSVAELVAQMARDVERTRRLAA